MVSVNLSEFGNMSDADKDKQAEAIMEAPSKAGNEGSPVLKARIDRFEQRYEMSSEELLANLEEGSQEETADISTWLFLLSSKESHVAG